MRFSLNLTAALGGAVLFIAGSVPAICETWDQLKGLSISFSYKEHAVRKIVGSSNDYRHDRWEQLQKLYIGSTGRIFQYSQHSLGKIGPSTTVWQLDKVQPTGNDRICHDGSMVTWTFSNGHLSMIYKEPEGFKTFTVAVDPVAMTCSVAIVYQVDAVSGRLVQGDYGATCTRFEELSHDVDSTTCSVKRGNIFADDQ
jgi:hypothetical protein